MIYYRNRRKYTTLLLFPLLVLFFVLSGYAATNDNNDTAPGQLDKKGKYPSPVPDTGQVHCYDNSRMITCAQPGEPFYGQDADYTINPPEYKTIEAVSGRIIIDRITGLAWQADIDDKIGTWSEAVDFADSLPGSGPYAWRLPEIRELESIINYGLVEQSIPVLSGGDRPEKNCLWSLTSRVFPSLVAMALCTHDNQVLISNKDEKQNVSAVSGPAWKSANFTAYGNYMVLDNNTGLVWQATESRPMTWQQSLAYCQALELGGFKDWRLPTIRELATLAVISPAGPAIDAAFFPGCRPEAYWSGTTCAGYPAFAWYVDFNDGLRKNSGFKKHRYFVRAVRGGR